MSRLSKFKDRLGRLDKGDPGKESVKLNQTATIDGETTIITDHTGTFSELTTEQIMARNRAILAKVSHNPPFHKRFRPSAEIRAK